MKQTSKSSLNHLTVLDLTTQLPGPYGSMLLADLGATVLKLEPPGGDPLREFPPMFASVNRGKQSLVINLKFQQGQQVLHTLAEEADIVLEGFRPGVADRLGADYETLQRINPDVIYCSISGFGQTGPYRERSGHDINYISLGGLLGQAEQADGRPVPPPVLISDLASGMYAAIAVLAAVQHRTTTGRGQYIDLSMTESVTAWMAPEIARAHSEGIAPGRPLLSGLPHYEVFRTADDRYISIGIVYESQFWRRLCDVLGLEEWKELTTEQRMTQNQEIRRRLQDIISTASREIWDRRLQEADVPCGPVYALDELPEDPQFQAREIFRDVTASDGSSSRQVIPPFRFSEMPVGTDTPPPGLGEHSTEILSRHGFTNDQIVTLKHRKIVM
ncbi:MAG: CaiB/BaiF CoA-transferase family protein [Gemmatimonadota bacterium]|nr:CaiB/BaiF CoA-transferase family protein [Gemmatimonadota bacterium]